LQRAKGPDENSSPIFDLAKKGLVRDLYNTDEEDKTKMTIAKLTIWRSLAVGLLVATCSSVVLAAVEFSAEMIQQGPEGQTSSGKMFVGHNRMRTEMSHQGQQIIRVTDEGRGVEWILFPEQKKYMEQKLGVPGGQESGAMSKPVEDPCGGMPGLICRKLGEEDIGGRKAVKWEMVASHQGQTMKSTQWIDKERGVPLRQEMPNGQTSELKFVGNEALGGRKVEKWEMVVTMPNQPQTRTFQWFDPELDLAIRQEFPGGIVSELTNIRVGKQPDELFNIPAGYERVSAPEGIPGGPQAKPTQH
jgi:outer membrane lipoprotein-sorting protein